MEQVAHCSAHGFDSMFIEDPEGLEQVTHDWLRDVVCIFEAQLTCCRLKHPAQDSCDGEGLVLPLLGLWYQVSLGYKSKSGRGSGSASLYEIMNVRTEAWLGVS